VAVDLEGDQRPRPVKTRAAGSAPSGCSAVARPSKEAAQGHTRDHDAISHMTRQPRNPRTRIEAGKLADLIVVRDNPLDDIDKVRALAMVFKGGRLVADHPSRQPS
jgi:hypothetical protein